MSRIGKSTAAGMARSVTGSGLLNCRATVVGTKEDAIHHNDTLLAYDEQVQVDPKVFWMTAYTIGNGRSASKHGSQRVTWILTWITSGEDSYPTFLKANKLPPIKEGQQVRLISIPAEIGPLGSFNTIHGFQDAETFAKQLAVLIEQNKGAIIVEFLKYFTANYDAAIQKLKENISKFKQTEKLKYPDLRYAPAWVSGVLDHFATVAATGELATTEANCTGWPTGWAMQAASEEFALWYDTEYKGSARIQHGAIQLLAWIENNKDRVEIEIEKGYPIAWIKVYDFKRACAPFDHQDVARELRRQGKLRSEKHDHLTRRKRIPGTDERPHYFCVVTTGDSGDTGDGSDTKWTSQPPLMRREPNRSEDVGGDIGDKGTIQ